MQKIMPYATWSHALELRAGLRLRKTWRKKACQGVVENNVEKDGTITLVKISSFTH